MNNKTSAFISRVVICSIIVFVIRFMIGKTISANVGFNILDYVGFISDTIAVTSIFAGLYISVLWRHDPFLKAPKLYESYSGVLHSEYNGKDILSRLAIKQTLFSVSIKLYTNESESHTIAASIDTVYDSDKLTYSYSNEPRMDVRKRSEIHYGTAILNIDNPKHIYGEYFTDRNTCGNMDFTADEE